MLRTLVVTVGALAVGRGIAACTDDVGTIGHGSPNLDQKPTDGDEHVTGSSPPVNAGDDTPKVPNTAWEARVKEIEADQTRLYARGPFARGDAGVWTGKENSHEPKASVVTVDGKKKVQVIVEHVMGKNGLDAGAPMDAGKDAADAGDAGRADAGRADGGRADAGDAGDAGRADAGDAGPKVDAGTPAVHFITTIYLRALVGGKDTVVGVWEFKSTDAAPPTVQFTLPAGVTSVTAFEWCTLHGLWKAEVLAL